MRELNPGALTSWAWGRPEKGLAAPNALLLWLLKYASVPPLNNDWGGPAARAKREALLIDRDPQTLEESRQLLAQYGGFGRAWYVFEGASYPDVFLETESMVIVVEGKRKEVGPKTRTTWMNPQPQMLRHLDCAFEICNGRSLAGFFLVEGDGGTEAVAAPQVWLDAARDTVSLDILPKALPHRSPAECEAIASAFLGVATWQRVCEEFNIPWPPAP